MIPNNCPKCQGFLVSEIAHDWLTGQSMELTYCVNCGERFDEVMSENRANRPLAPKKDRRILPRMVKTPQTAVAINI